MASFPDRNVDSPPPSKRPRVKEEHPVDAKSNGNATAAANALALTPLAPAAPALNPALSLPPLSMSILGTEPLDEFILDVSNFVHYMITSQPPDMGGHFEVEAKIGLLRDRRTSQRLGLPVRVETILNSNEPDVRFESNMSVAQHRHLNTLLNELLTNPSPPSLSSLACRHQHLVDTMHPAPSGERIRITRDEKTGAVLQCVRKVRLGDLNVYSPMRAADWRVSVNLEIPIPHPAGLPTLTRRKDRLSYSHEEFIIDLTQVTSSSPGGSPEIMHELEIEIARPALLLALAEKRNDLRAPEHERSAFDELIRAFVNNARILVRNVGGP